MRASLRSKTMGFSLLEMAVVLVIVGLTAAFIIKSQRPSDCYSPTQTQLVAIRTSLDHFVRAQNRYPTPAARNAGTLSATYGIEASGSAIDTVANGSNPVLYGALPFKALGLPASFATDCWGNQFTYIVTQYLTTSAEIVGPPTTGFMSAATTGGITIWTGASAAQTQLLTNVSYAVISHGENGIGAVTKNYTGSGHAWCSGTVPLDRNNCSISASPVKLVSATFNNGANAGNDYFDDLLIFAAKKSSNCNNSTYPVSWWDVTSTNQCNAIVTGPLANTVSESVSDVTGPTTGDASYKCVNGTPVLNSAMTPTCTAASSCMSQPITWNSCSDTVPALSDGGTAQVSYGDLNYTGYGTATCNNGTVTLSNNACSPTDCVGCSGANACPARYITWGNGNCIAQLTGQNSGTTSPSKTNTASGHSGTATFNCNNNVWTIASGSCI